MSAYAHILEQHIAADLHDKLTLKMSAKDCADYCAYVFSSIQQKPIITASTKFTFIASPLHKLSIYGLGNIAALKTQPNEAQAIAAFLNKMGIQAPKPKYKKLGFLPLKIRLESVKWWATKLRIKAARTSEHLKIKTGLVRKYCSDELLEKTRENQKRMMQWLEQTTIKHTDTKDEISLKHLHTHSLSNLTLRTCELTIRSKGLTEYYGDLGYRAITATVTASSSWHRLATKKDPKGNKYKVLNPRYNGASPKDVQNHFNNRFGLVRTSLSNKGIKLTAVRVAEPHQDGCTHWHFVIWCKNGKEAKQVIQAFRKYFLFYDGPVQKADLKHRLDFDTVNPAKGDAVAYILAYINKGITGEHIDDHTDQNGEKIATGKEGAERTRAWAKCWGFRQYQFLGAPPVNVYRELRRVRCEAMGRGKAQQITVPTFEQFKQLQAFYKNTTIPEPLKDIWHAANEGDFGRYIKAYYNAQGQEHINQSSNFLNMSCFVFCFFKTYKKNVVESLKNFASQFIKPKPSLLKHGFKEDMAELANFYGDVQSVPDQVINKLESINGYLEPKSQVYGVCVAGAKMLTRPYVGYFKNVWKLVTHAKKQQQASVQDRLDTYAGVRGANGLDDEFWGDVVDFGARHGAFAFQRPKAA